MADLTGMDLGRYHILEPLGEGGMAAVYKAYDTRLEREVAVKVIRTDQFASAALERILKRFEREAKALARLTHPNIVGVIDYGEYEGAPYLVMPYLPGGTLKQRLGKPIPWQEAARLLLPVARALQFAHNQNIIHRDVKPSNILITLSGEPMLTDFGIAKVLDLEEGQTLTTTGVGIGTPEYMSPEQGLGRPVDGRTDVYSLGIVLYEMVTGRKPYIADTPMAVVDKHLHDPLPRPRQFVPSLPASVEKVLFKALAKRQEDRYPSMADFAGALDGLLRMEMGGNELGDEAEDKKRKTKNVKQEIKNKIQPPRILPEITRDEQIIPASSVPPANPGGPARPGIFGARPGGPVGPVSRWGAIAGIALAIVVLGIVAGILLSRPHPPIPTQTPTNTLVPRETFTQTSNFTPTLIPTLGIGSTWTRPADGMVMVYVPTGEFSMGSPAGTGNDDEHPQHTVNLEAYWIDKTDVTNAMYAKCVLDDKCQPPQAIKSYTRDSYYGNSQYDDYPAIYVDWNQANTYCQWAGANLPTEAQWEKAARGTGGRTYPWGNDSPTCRLANYYGCVGDTSAVDAHPSGASPYGALDMAGNVWQWLADWHDANYYANSPASNAAGPASGQSRLLRGGSWVSLIHDIRSAIRNWDVPDARDNLIGFRCSRLSQ